MLLPRIARQQHGVFTRKQARSEGFSAKVIARRCAEGVWQEPVDGAFCLTGSPPTLEARTIAATLVTRGVASHGTAAHLHRLTVPELARGRSADTVHVTMTPRVHAVVAGVTEHRLPLDPSEVIRINRIPCTTRERTVVDLLASMPGSDAATLLFRALQNGWLRAEHLSVAIERRRGRHGTPQLRTLHAMTGTNAHSVAEHALHQILRAMPDLSWTANAGLRLRGRRVVVDVLLEGTPVVLELDGQRFHSSTDQFQRDRERQNILVGAGYVVLRFTWFDVTSRPAYVRQVIEQNLRSRSLP